MLELNDASFKKEISGGKGYSLVDFWAPWCGPCLMLAPILEQVSDDMKGKLKFAKLNVDENQELASEYGVMSIPTLAIFKDGEIIAQRAGAMPKEMLKGWIKESIGAK